MGREEKEEILLLIVANLDQGAWDLLIYLFPVTCKFLVCAFLANYRFLQDSNVFPHLSIAKTLYIFELWPSPSHFIQINHKLEVHE